jgi:prepilin-type N-terminal cleavage/methylation domain-containing protein
MRRKSGFTIIEVSLVLAIGGLILMMVFIALPSLQRSQRDAQRREDVISLIENIKKYQQNNRGALPSGESGEFTRNDELGAKGWQDLLNNYLGENFKDPNGTPYTLMITNSASYLNNPTEYNNKILMDNNKILIVKQATCSGNSNGNKVKQANSRKLAALYELEVGGTFCANT